MLPSLASDDGQPTAELRLARLREQVAVVRTLVDHIDHFARPGNTEGLSDQLIEELARLGRRVSEAAALMAGVPHDEDSGIFIRRSRDAAGSSLDSIVP